MTTESIRSTDHLVRISGSYGFGNGIILAEHGIIATCEHIIRREKWVVIENDHIGRRSAKVVFLDHLTDIAFLQSDIDVAPLATAGQNLTNGVVVTAKGFNQSGALKITNGIIDDRKEGEFVIYQHTANLDHSCSGGTLELAEGEIIGMNIFDPNTKVALAVSISEIVTLAASIVVGDDLLIVRCYNCGQMTTLNHKNLRCEYCRSTNELYASGFAGHLGPGIINTIEQVLRDLGYDPEQVRRGMNNWEIERGSALISITYHDRSGLIMADAHLCRMPERPSMDLLEYLLRKNHQEGGLTFSVSDGEIILSALIHDKYLQIDGAKRKFNQLFEMSDFQDNILVEELGASWLRTQY